MIRTIHKYKLNAGSINCVQYIDMPGLIEVLDVAWQAGQIMVWACVVPEEPIAPVSFYIAFTGAQLPEESENWGHIRSLQNGAFVYHVYLSHEYT